MSLVPVELTKYRFTLRFNKEAQQKKKKEPDITPIFSEVVGKAYSHVPPHDIPRALLNKNR